jgi:hypothetical protein
MATQLYSSKRSKIKNFKANVTNKTDADGTVTVSINYQFTQSLEALNQQRIKIGRDNLKKIEQQIQKIEEKGEVDDNLKNGLKTIRTDLHNSRLEYSRSLVKLYNTALDSYNNLINQMLQWYYQHMNSFGSANLATSNAGNQTVTDAD